MSSTSSNPPRSDDAPGLRRSLGLTHATAMVVGTIIGASIFVQPSEITQQMPSVPASCSSGSRPACSRSSARSSAPSWRRRFRGPAASTCSCARRVRRAVGFLWGWAMFWSMHSGIIAAIAMVFARYTAHFVPLERRGHPARRGRRHRRALGRELRRRAARQPRAERRSPAAKVARDRRASSSAGSLWSGAGAERRGAPTPAIGAGGFILALVAGLFAFGGWHMVTYTADETRDAERDDPARAAPRHAHRHGLLRGTERRSTCACCRSTSCARRRASRPTPPTRCSAAAARALMAALVMVSTFGAVNGIILAGPRVYYSMAAGRPAVPWVGAVHPRFGTPHRAIVLQAVWASVLGADRHLPRAVHARDLHRVDLLRG